MKLSEYIDKCESLGIKCFDSDDDIRRENVVELVAEAVETETRRCVKMAHDWGMPSDCGMDTPAHARCRQLRDALLISAGLLYEP